jgi:hypothetical protein
MRFSLRLVHAMFRRSFTADLDNAGRFPHWPAEPGEALVRGAHFFDVCLRLAPRFGGHERRLLRDRSWRSQPP